MRVLLTHRSLMNRAGTELFVRDVARELRQRGHSPVVFSPVLGEVAREIRRTTVPVVDNLDSLSAAPDVIHGHHRLETMQALLRFPETPAVYFCQDWFQDVDRPPLFPRVRRYVAIDEPCRDKLLFENGVPEERLRLMPAFVDPERFRRRDPLPARPTRALLYSSYAKDNEYLAAVRAACASTGIELDVLGAGVGKVTTAPEDALRQYDVVFAKGKSAIEALSVGTAVVLYVMRHAGPMVTTRNIDQLIAQNFGIRAMLLPLTPKEVRASLENQLRSYDPDDAAAVSAAVRQRLVPDVAMQGILELYEDAVREQAETGTDRLAEARASAAFLGDLSAQIRASGRDTFFARISRTPILGPIGRRVYRTYQRVRPPVWWQHPVR